MILFSESLQFCTDEARIILIGDLSAEIPPLYCVPGRRFGRTRAYIMTDFTQSVGEQLAVIGRVHACGYWRDSASFFMITNGLPGDFKRVISLAHQLEAQGASIEVFKYIYTFYHPPYLYTFKYIFFCFN